MYDNNISPMHENNKRNARCRHCRTELEPGQGYKWRTVAPPYDTDHYLCRTCNAKAEDNCNCVLPEQSCPACRVVAGAVDGVAIPF